MTGPIVVQMAKIVDALDAVARITQLENVMDQQLKNEVFARVFIAVVTGAAIKPNYEHLIAERAIKMADEAVRMLEQKGLLGRFDTPLAGANFSND